MNYQTVLTQAKEHMMPKCRVCKECNGIACRSEIPGLGGKGSGGSFIRNCEAVKAVKLNLDVLYEDHGQDCSCELFGTQFSAPIFAAPISGMNTNYTGYLTEGSQAAALVPGCVDAGILAFTGDGASDNFFLDPLQSVADAKGMAVPTIKPWDRDTVFHKMKQAEATNPVALCMDIDSAGLPLLAAAGKPVCGKSAEELREIICHTERPFLVKGIMTARAAILAAGAGAYGIVVSNHGGRVLDSTPGTFEVLEEICRAVQGHTKVFVDGGIRTGYDVFKALALGADAVLIGRPFMQAAHGGGREGVTVYAQKMIAELKDAMKMTGCATLADITREKVTILP